jgi:hypothetical protein
MTSFKRTYLLAAIAVLCASLGAAAVAQAAATDKGAVKKGVSWIRKAGLSQFPGPGFQADTVSALVAARRSGARVPSSSVARFVNSLKDQTADYASGAGPAGKLTLAAVASGNNPRCFGPASGKTDLVAVIRSSYRSSTGQFGNSVYDQALAILALKAAHEKVPSKAISFAKSRRGKYGWNYAMSKSAGDDVESSAIMIEALRAAGVSRKSSALKAAYKWITYQRNADGGYNPDTPNGETQADTTSYVIRAADALGKNNKNAKRALRALQKSNGAVRSQPSAESDYHGIATGNAVLALSGRHYPVVSRSKAGKSCA